MSEFEGGNQQLMNDPDSPMEGEMSLQDELAGLSQVNDVGRSLILAQEMAELRREL